MLVHQDGRADEQYRRKYPGIGAPQRKIRLATVVRWPRGQPDLRGERDLY